MVVQDLQVTRYPRTARGNPCGSREETTIMAIRKSQGPRRRSSSPFLRRRVEVLEDRLSPAVFKVNSLLDAAVDLTDATVTLRDAIHAANNDLQVTPGGPVGGGADEIVFDASLYGASGARFTLSQGELAISSDLTITGPGAGRYLTISGNNASRIFNVNAGHVGPTISVQMTWLILTEGRDTGGGGAIRNGENLRVADTVINENGLRGFPTTIAFPGAGILNFNFGSLYLTSTNVWQNGAGLGDGGGIYNLAGTVTVTNSSILGNEARDGGGIFNAESGKVTLANSLLGSFANGRGGGIFNASGGVVTVARSNLGQSRGALAGGGIFNLGTATVSNSTLGANTSDGDGGGIWNGGTLVLRSSTLTQNRSDFDNTGSGVGGGFSHPPVRYCTTPSSRATSAAPESRAMM